MADSDPIPENTPDDEKGISRVEPNQNVGVIGNVTEAKTTVHADVLNQVEIFDAACAIRIVEEAKVLNNTVCKYVEQPANSNTQLHILVHDNHTYYLLGENHGDRESLNCMRKVIDHLATVHRKDICIYYESTPASLTIASYTEAARSGHYIQGSICSPMICAKEIAKQMPEIMTEDTILPSFSEPVIKAGMEKHQTPKNQIMGIFLFIYAATAFFALPKEKQDDRLWHKIYESMLVSMLERFEIDKTSLEQGYYFARQPDKKTWREKIVKSMRIRANELTVANLERSQKKSDARHIVAICGVEHLAAVFKGLGLQEEMYRIKKGEDA